LNSVSEVLLIAKNLGASQIVLSLDTDSTVLQVGEET